MTKSEKLGRLIGTSAEMVENEIDKGMWDILINLNEKNYKTIFCCEGHLNEFSNKGKNYWEGYLAFDKTYKFVQYPKGFYKNDKQRRFFYWEGFGEESRQKYLTELYNWSCCLPKRKIEEVTYYVLEAKFKAQPNRDAKLLCNTTDYEEIRCILNRADMEKYFDFKLYEKVLTN